MNIFKYLFFLLLFIILIIILLIVHHNNVDWCIIYADPQEEGEEETEVDDDIYLHLECDNTDWQLIYSEPLFNYCTLEPYILALKAELKYNNADQRIDNINLKTFTKGFKRDIRIKRAWQFERSDPSDNHKINVLMEYSDCPECESEVELSDYPIKIGHTLHLDIQFEESRLLSKLITANDPIFEIHIPPKICNIIITE